MLPEVKHYLDEVKSRLYLRREVECQLIHELDSYFEEKIADLQKQGIPEEQAARKAIEDCGPPEKLSRLLYEACSRGSWTIALKLSLPHFLAAALFASSSLHKLEILLLAFAIVSSVSLYGWRRLIPDWLYSWVGYALLPLFGGGFLLLPLVWDTLTSVLSGNMIPAVGILLVIAACYMIGMWLVLRISMTVIKRDWLLASLMLAPVPIIGCWLFHLQQTTGMNGVASLPDLNQPVAQGLLLLGITSVLFIRLRPRLLKAGAIITVSSISMLSVGQSLWGNLGFWGLMGLSIFSLIFFLVPAVTHLFIARSQTLPDNQPGSDNLAHHLFTR
jgi:hypothetical protein